MGLEIDKRIVEMVFNNSQFEKGVATTNESLGKLKENLKFEDSAKGLKNLQDAGSKFNMEPVATAIGTVTEKFSAFEVMGLTVLTNITNKAVDAGLKLVKSLSVDNISAGWEKFGDKTTSVATLVSQGYELEDVNSQLERLNWFTDETSYNFTDMVSNIAKFTAAGQDLNSSVTAMEGIANWAALSGQNASTASRAMYQLSQAMSSGVMRKEDYKSIQNASMDTQEFRQNALDAAVALGTLKKNADGTYESLVNAKGAFNINQFADHLTEDAWFTSDVMMSVYKQYSGAVDQIYEYSEEKGITASEAIEELGDSVDAFGLKAFKAAQEARTWGDVVDSIKDAVGTQWMTAFETIFGTYEEAKTLWTNMANELYDVFTEDLWSLNEVLSKWGEAGGRLDLFAYDEEKEEYGALWNFLHSINDIVGTIKESFAEIFIPDDPAKSLKTFTENLNALSKRLIPTEETLEKLRSIFTGIFSVGKLIGNIFGRIGKSIATAFSGTGEIVLDTAASFGNFLTNITNTITESGKLEAIFEKITNAIIPFADLIKMIIARMADLSETFGTDPSMFFINGIDEALTLVRDAIAAVIQAFGALTGKDVSGALSTFYSKSYNVIETIRTKLVEFQNFIVAFFNKLKVVIPEFFGKIKPFWENVKKFFADAKSYFTDLIKNLQPLGETAKLTFASMKEWFSNFFGKVKESLPTFDSFKKVTSSIFKFILDTIKNLGPSIASIGKLVISAITGIGKFVGTILGGLKDLFNDGTMKNVMEVVGSGVNTGIFAILGGSIAGFIGTLTKATKGAGGAVDSLKGIFDGIKDMLGGSKISDIKELAVSIGILAASAILLSAIDTGKLSAGVTALGAIFAELVASAKVLNGGDKINTKGFITLAASVLVLTMALDKASKIDSEAAKTGILTLAGLLAELAIAGKILQNGNGKSMDKTGEGLLMVSGAVLVLVLSLKMLQKVDPESVKKGVIAIGLILTELGVFANMAGGAKKMIQIGLGMIALSGAILMLQNAVKFFGDMDIPTLVQGLAALTVIIGELTAFAAIGGKNGGKVLAASLGMILLATSVGMLQKTVDSFGQMALETLVQGLAALTIVLAEVTAVLILLGSSALGVMAGALALQGAALAMLMFIPVLKVLGGMEVGEIAKSLLALAGTFAVIGVAALVLGPMTLSIMGLAGALALIGIAAAAFGAGLLMISTALAAFGFGAETLVEAIIVIIKDLIVAIPDLLAAFAESLKNSVSSIVDMLVTIIKVALAALRETIPDIVDTILVLLKDVLASVAANIQPIIESILEIIIGIFTALTNQVPALIESIFGFLKVLFKTIIEVADMLDIKTFAKASLALAELAVMLAEVTAIGVLGIAATATLPLIANNLSSFIENLNPFLRRLQGIDPAILEGAKNLAEMVLIITAASVLDSLTSWFTGDNKLVEFGQQLVEFGPYLKEYSDAVEDVKPDAVQASANAAKSLSELADNLPKHGGVVDWFTGDATLATFGEELAAFGPSIAKYSDAVKSVKPVIVTASAAAASSLVKIADNLPKHGGLTDWITGDATLATFGAELATFGPSMAIYSAAVKNVKPNAVIASATAAAAMISIAGKLPKHGGLTDWVTGDATLATFGEELAAFGPSIAEYSKAIVGLKPKAITASSSAISALAAATNNLPKHGGFEGWLSGDSSLSVFGKELASFGPHMADYAKAVEDVEASVVTSSASAAKSLAEMAASLPEKNGVAQWFTGESTLSSFGRELASFGPHMADYYEAIKDVKSGVVISSSSAAKALMGMAENLPNQGGISSWFSGELTLSEFGKELASFGPHMADYAESIKDVKEYVVTASTRSAEALMEMANNLPNQGGIASWFTGDLTLSKFGEELESFGPHLKKYADSISGITNDTVIASAAAASSLAEMASKLPDQGGVKSLFAGDNKLDKFGEMLESFAPHFKNYANSIDGIESDTVVASAAAAMSLADFANALPNNGGVAAWFTGDNTLDKFGEKLEAFASSLKKYATDVSNIAWLSIDSSIIRAKKFIELAKELVGVDTSVLSGFAKNIKVLANNGITNFISAFENADRKAQAAIRTFTRYFTDALKSHYPAYTSIGQMSAASFANGLSSNSAIAVSTATNFSNNVTNSLRPVSTSSYNIGTQIPSGMASGISANAQTVYDAATRVANNALGIVKTVLMIQSPSKKFAEVGKFSDLGFAYGLKKYSATVDETAETVGLNAVDIMSGSIQKISDSIDSDFEFDPTIRPVVDLSNVNASANAMNGLFASKSISLAAEGGLSINAQGSMLDILGAQVEANQNGTAELVRELESVKADILSLGDDIREMRIVMDGDALVGRILKRIDSGLGKMTTYKGRAN